MKPVLPHLLATIFTLLCTSLLYAAPASAPEWQAGMDSVSVTVQNPDTVVICLGDTLQLEQTNNVNNAGLVWRPAEGFLDATDNPNPRVVPLVSRYYVVTVGSGEMTASDSVYVDIDALILPELISDTTVCEGLALSLVQNPVEDSQGTTYDYSPGRLLRDSTVPNAVFDALPIRDTVFQVVATSATGMCVDSASFAISVIPSRLEIAQEDTVFVCLNEDAITLSAQGTPGNPPVTWFPDVNIIGNAQSNSISVRAVSDITYFATATVNGCPQTDSVAVRVDSLPGDLTLTPEPIKDPYCIGDTFYLLGNIFDVQDYPLIEHDWLNPPGLESPNELYNAIFTAIDTMVYQRVTTNGACVDTAEIAINVVEPPNPVFDPAVPLACNGMPFQVNLSFDPPYPGVTVEWMDPVGGTLSCTDCLDPIITTTAPVEYEIELTFPGSDNCPASAMYSVGVTAEQLPTLTTQTAICPGEELQLITGNVVDGATYTISGGGQMLMGANVRVSPTEETTYTIITDDPNCGRFEQMITISIRPEVSVELTGPTCVTPGETVTLTASTTPPNAPGNYIFTLPDGTTSAGRTLTTRPEVTGTYSVVFTDAGGCQTQTATTIIEVGESVFVPQISALNLDGTSLGAEPSLVRGGMVQLTVDNIPGDFSGTFSWEGNGNPPTAEGPTITVTAPADADARTLDYFATANDPNGCSSTTNITVTLTDEVFKVPEIISANRDGINDMFRVFFEGGTAVGDYNLIVFNRWGQNVFETTDPTEGWDGTKNGKPQNLDTYLYVARFTVDGREVELDGQFALVR